MALPSNSVISVSFARYPHDTDPNRPRTHFSWGSSSCRSTRRDSRQMLSRSSINGDSAEFRSRTDHLTERLRAWLDERLNLGRSQVPGAPCWSLSVLYDLVGAHTPHWANCDARGAAIGCVQDERSSPSRIIPDLGSSQFEYQRKLCRSLLVPPLHLPPKDEPHWHIQADRKDRHHYPKPHA